jgi:REP element-mobilizing transposase RayT
MPLVERGVIWHWFSQEMEEAVLGKSLLGRRYFVSTVGVDEEMIRRYVRHQAERERQEERQREGYDLFGESANE